MINSAKCLGYFLLLCIIFVVSPVYGHAEKDKSRYVSPDGVNIGLCDNPLRPCKTISYATSRAAKGDKVLVAAGNYHLNSIDEILTFKSQIIPIIGGYNKFDHFASQSPSTNITQLTGLPSDLTDYARNQGFKVIADGKSKFSRQQISRINNQSVASVTSHGSAKCLNGIANDFPCKNLELVSHVALNEFSLNPPTASDIWGHVDLNTGQEYALIGTGNGVVVFDLSIPESPREIGTIVGLISSWRDIKVYQYFDYALNAWQAYAYATVDYSNDNVMIINLNQLPHSVSLVKKDIAVRQAHNVYISNVDYTYNISLNSQTPTLQFVGSEGNSVRSTSFLSYSLENPTSLSILPVGKNKTSGYTHDGTSLVIEDERTLTDCGLPADDACKVFIDFSEKEIKLWNVTTPGEEKKLSDITYNDVSLENQYVHSGWWSEDKKYIFAHDEFDEYRGELNTTLRIFDIQSLTTPKLAGTWTGPTKATDHNGYVRGNRYYMSNYKRGLTVLDITDATNPKEMGYFDTFISSDTSGFDGAWGVYPYLPSGLLLVSDITGGLFVLKDNTLTTEHGSLSFSQSSITTASDNEITLSINRQDGTIGNIGVDWELLPGSALVNEDYESTSGSLEWSSGDRQSKNISIRIKDNLNLNEPTETFFVRLFNPKNGATISSPTYLSVHIEGQSVPGLIGFDSSELIIAENKSDFSIDVYRTAGKDGEVSVNYSIDPITVTINEDLENISGTLTWADGDTDKKTIIIPLINDDDFESDEAFKISLSSASNAKLASNSTINIVIKDDENNKPPTITIAENFEVAATQTARLTSTAIDPEGDSITYLWTQVSGDFVYLRKPNQENITFIAPKSAGILVLKLSATDLRGASSEKTVTITVKEPIIEVSTPVTASGVQNLISLFFLMVLSLRIKRIQLYH